MGLFLKDPFQFPILFEDYLLSNYWALIFSEIKEALKGKCPAGTYLYFPATLESKVGGSLELTSLYTNLGKYSEILSQEKGDGAE